MTNAMPYGDLTVKEEEVGRLGDDWVGCCSGALWYGGVWHTGGREVAGALAAGGRRLGVRVEVERVTWLDEREKVEDLSTYEWWQA
jgi:hypothetical protein